MLRNAIHGEQEEALGYLKPPPAYPCIVGSKAAARGIANNLMDKFVRMPALITANPAEDDEIGTVMSYTEFSAWGEAHHLKCTSKDEPNASSFSSQFL
ncbi:hypothetical protein M422DRAFT_30547 [Sphaerobolus stellatus SS14]|uniref:Unplaced genomic scaffold SPHSTscaffold_44, whole genome shotgun sequence n=1 Tax=Sphaerobolus stellatus (strain SS14) TaxID=990650 RepID=A0A0C9TKJ6_SPHS4|nr:hypothetical protein M422DRAFT_36602 [Sphaerobolus stellatus SS14]KIJ43956.1 hypothetical protein M422DRAFT_30547 [Sphaerobolus stellatus SS14]